MFLLSYPLCTNWSILYNKAQNFSLICFIVRLSGNSFKSWVYRKHSIMYRSSPFWGKPQQNVCQFGENFEIKPQDLIKATLCEVFQNIYIEMDNTISLYVCLFFSGYTGFYFLPSRCYELHVIFVQRVMSLKNGVPQGTLMSSALYLMCKFTL